MGATHTSLSTTASKKQGEAAPWEQYQQLSSMKDKFQFALKLKLDPTGAFCSVQESSTCSASNKESSLTGWMPKWEFAKLVGLKYDLQDQESLAILDAELEGSRPGLMRRSLWPARGISSTSSRRRISQSPPVRRSGRSRA